MAIANVFFSGTRLNDSDTNTDWVNFNSTGGAAGRPAEAIYNYQGNAVVNKKVNTSAATKEGIAWSPGVGGVDMTSANLSLLFVKCFVADSFDLNTTYGAELGIGSDGSNFASYCVAGTDANNDKYNTWPIAGGYLITSINPNVDGWIEANTGTPDFTNMDYVPFGASFINGAAKAENVALDAIDVGVGLHITRGDGADPDCNFGDFINFDPETKANRYGVVVGTETNIISVGKLFIGNTTGSAATNFTDNDAIVTFPDGYHGSNSVGITCYLNNASDDINIGSLFISEGKDYLFEPSGYDVDTRGNLNIIGTSGTFDFTGQIRNFREINLNSVSTISGADIEAKCIVPNSASITGTIIKTSAPAANATLLTFPESSTSINGCDFIQTNAGHSMELAVTNGSYNFNNLTFSGYNTANNQTDSAILVTATTGTTTINLSGTTEPSVRTYGATVNFVSSVSVTITNLVANTEVRVYNSALPDTDPNYQIAGVEDVSRAVGDTSEENGTASGPDSNNRYSFNFSASQNVDLKVRFFNTSFVENSYWISNFVEQNSGTETTLSIQAAQRKDRVYNNPPN